MSAVVASEVAARFVAAQEALLGELERAAGDPAAASSLERSALRCAEAFEAFRRLHEAGTPMPVDTVARARRLSVLLSARAEVRTDVLAGEIARTRTARRVLDGAVVDRGSDHLGGSCDIAG